MAIYRMNTNTGRIGSASPHADYVLGEGSYKYKKDEIAFEESHLPNGLSAREFWKMADENEPVNGRTYREFKLTLPHEFSIEENTKVLKDFMEKELGNDYYYTVVIHNKERSRCLTVMTHFKPI